MRNIRVLALIMVAVMALAILQGETGVGDSSDYQPSEENLNASLKGDAFTLCTHEIQARVRHPKTISLDRSVEKVMSLDDQAAVAIIMFSAKNSFGVADEFKAHCTIIGGAMYTVKITKL